MVQVIITQKSTWLDIMLLQQVRSPMAYKKGSTKMLGL